MDGALCRVLRTPGEGLWVGTRGVTAFHFLPEDLYFKTRLQFDETAKHLQNLESATRKAVCAAVKEFNKNQVYPRLCLEGRMSTQPLPQATPCPRPKPSPSPARTTQSAWPCQGLPHYRDE